MALRYGGDLTDFKRWWKDQTVDHDALIEVELESAESDIDTELRRYIEVADPVESTARSYRMSGASRVLVIDDAAAIVSVVENGTTLTANTDYVAEPLNGRNEFGHPVPYAWLRRIGRDWYRSDDGAALVVVTARWGWNAIPATLVSARNIVAADRLSNREYRNGVMAILETGAIGARENRSVAMSVKSFRHPYKVIGVA